LILQEFALRYNNRKLPALIPRKAIDDDRAS